MSDPASFGIISVLPPILAIVLAVRTKQVYVSLMAGIWLGWTILKGWNPLSGLIAAVEALVGVFADQERTMILMVSVSIGALLTSTQYSGGMAGFIGWIEERGWVRNRRGAGLLAWGLGFFIFVESVIGVLISGTITRPLFDRFRISREKLSYILDSTCAPKATLVPLNTWGAYIIALLTAQGVQNPVRTLVASIPINFYCILAILLALVVVLTEKDFGPMKTAELRVRERGELLRPGAEPLVAGEALMLQAKEGVPRRPVNLLLPVATMIAMLPVVLLVTGSGNLMEGSGTQAAFWAVLTGLLVAAASSRAQGILTIGESTDMFMKGIGALIPVGLLLLLAFGIGDVCGELGTGIYIAQAAEAGLPAATVPAALFCVSGVVAFSTGTSFGTWAIMLPIAIPMIGILDLHQGLTIAAVLGGGIFGDHCSPISDSTIVSSMAAGTDHIDHVRTQLPYALLAAFLTTILYLVLGFLI